MRRGPVLLPCARQPRLGPAQAALQGYQAEGGNRGPTLINQSTRKADKNNKKDKKKDKKWVDQLVECLVEMKEYQLVVHSVVNLAYLLAVLLVEKLVALKENIEV